jgi:hypothetical protein
VVHVNLKSVLLYSLRKKFVLFVHDFSRAAGSVPAPDFSPGERVFKPAETLYLAMIGLLALVRLELLTLAGALQDPEKLCFVSGHEFSRSHTIGNRSGFSPCPSCPVLNLSATRLAPVAVFSGLTQTL